MDNDGFNWQLFGIGAYLLMRNRRLDEERRALEPHRRAKEAAWWAGLTPAQQDAYEQTLWRQQAIDVPTKPRPARRRSMSRGWVIFWAVVAVYIAVVTGVESFDSRAAAARRSWCLEEVEARGYVNPQWQQAMDWCVANYEEARRINKEIGR